MAFDLDEYLRQSTAASGVPEKVKDRNTLLSAARMVLPKLSTRSGSKKGRSGSSVR